MSRVSMKIPGVKVKIHALVGMPATGVEDQYDESGAPEKTVRSHCGPVGSR